jgi:hypothetical protein
VSFGQSLSVTANGVRLNGDPAGFSEFFQSTKGLEKERGVMGVVPEIVMSGLRMPLPGCLAMSWEFHRPAMSNATLPEDSMTWPAIS